jgi:hypothetical protein
MMMSKGRKGKSKLSLCWSCERAGRASCEWFSDGKPVEGWEAIPTTVLMGGGRRAQSFLIRQCPKFVPYHARRECKIERDW